jgi:hypothetical protein
MPQRLEWYGIETVGDVVLGYNIGKNPKYRRSVKRKKED